MITRVRSSLYLDQPTRAENVQKWQGLSKTIKPKQVKQYVSELI